MTFRANEAASNGFESVKNYLIPRSISRSQKNLSEKKLFDILDKYGPVVETYPSWHPIVTHHDDRYPVISPSEQCHYNGLDHTCFFMNAFITCPYHDGQKIIDSVEELPRNSVAEITAERLNVQFYVEDANPILVSCNWREDLQIGSTIPASVVVPLILQKELSCWEGATCGETWESMRLYFLGSPHGSRSSLFVDQKTALTMKKIWNLLINTGMYGPIKVSNQQ